MRTKIFFLFAMLASTAASAQVTNVEPVSANYANKTVSFRVWWNAGSRDATHLSKVWLWVDYITVNSDNTTSGNSWTRATVGTVSGGVTSYDGSYRNGFWLEGNASTNYSATLTVQLTNVPAKFNWCAYVSDCPPNVTAANGTYTFKGTPPFTLIAANGTTSQTVTGNTLAASALTITPTTIKDKTECPGIFCIYSGSDLYIDATHLCQQRTSGAKNWEAWIKDSRDNKIYQIAQLSTGLWTMDDYLNYKNHTAVVNELCSNADPNGTEYWRNILATTYATLCPNGWRLPTTVEYTTTVNEWITHLDKIFQTTGETIWANGRGYYCNMQSGFTAYITVDCIGLGTYGHRICKMPPPGCGSDVLVPCGTYTSGTNSTTRFSGYARCVRD
ncbi:MAG: hypothetical protein LBG31_00305 [Prevotellaceae bacterium]|jgi:hypothetical protein|nr:hypothetical protein [Prevotellaceae bacterium]